MEHIDAKSNHLAAHIPCSTLDSNQTTCAGEMSTALSPALPSGRRRVPVKIDDTIDRRFRRGVEKHLLGRRVPLPLTVVYFKTLESEFSVCSTRLDGTNFALTLPPEDQLPSLNQFRRWYRHYIENEVRGTDRPQSATRKQQRAARPTSTPWATCWTDHVDLDVYLVPRPPTAPNRPRQMTAHIDSLTRLLVGVRVTSTQAASIEAAGDDGADMSVAKLDFEHQYWTSQGVDWTVPAELDDEIVGR